MEERTELKLLNRAKKQKILDLLNEEYGIENLNYLFLQTTRKLRIFSGALSKEEMIEWLKNINIDNIGLYFASWEDSGIRLNLDAVHLISKQASKNIIHLAEEQADSLFLGSEIELNIENKKEIEMNNVKEGFIIVKNKEDIIGTGKLTKTRILNYLPKERRIKN